MKKLNALMLILMAALSFAAANASAAMVDYFSPAAMACRASYVADQTLLSVEADGSLYNASNANRWVTCGLSTRAMGKRGEVKANVYGHADASGMLRCSLRVTLQADQYSVVAAKELLVDGAFVLRFDDLEFTYDVNNPPMVIVSCDLPIRTSLTSIQVIDYN